MKQKIISEFYEKTKDVSALIFSQGSKLLNIEHCSMIPHQIEEGEFGDGFNIRIKGTGEFFAKKWMELLCQMEMGNVLKFVL